MFNGLKDFLKKFNEPQATEAPRPAMQGSQQPSLGQRLQQPNQLQSNQMVLQRPQEPRFKMYEDNSFVGNPREFSNPTINLANGTSSPRFKFYEDNSFTDNARDLKSDIRSRIGY